jgi:hypothetical protein
MTFNLHTFYCHACAEVTPHEMNEDGQKARCITCLNKRSAQSDLKFQHETERHIAALDGHGNRGEQRRGTK